MAIYLDDNRRNFAFRRAVTPEDLRPFILTATGKPRTEWRYSLKTTNRREALERCHVWEVKTDLAIRKAEAARDAWLIASAKSPKQKERERRQWDAEREADELQSHEAFTEDAEFEEREPIRQALIAKLGRPRSQLSPAEAAMRDLMDDAEFDAPDVKAARAKKIVEDWKAGEAEASEWFAAASGQPTKPTYPSLLALFDRYAAGGTAKPPTIKAWRRMIVHLKAFLGHDNAALLTRADASGWMDALRDEKKDDGTPVRGPKTIREGYLTALKTVLDEGVSTGSLTENVARGIKVRVPKRQRLRSPNLTKDEVLTILRATLEPQSLRLTPEHALARRWVPWICAYTGARVNEITQLRAEDVAMRDGIWAFQITPAAGSQKSDKAWWVPLHSHLVEQGFPEVAMAKVRGPLFYNPARSRGGSEANPQRKKVGEYLATWVRSIGVDDPDVQPNHGWRHLFKTRARDAGLDPEAREAIPGHANKTDGQSYGEKSVTFLSLEIEKLPRFEV